MQWFIFKEDGFVWYGVNMAYPKPSYSVWYQNSFWNQRFCSGTRQIINIFTSRWKTLGAFEFRTVSVKKNVFRTAVRKQTLLVGRLQKETRILSFVLKILEIWNNIATTIYLFLFQNCYHIGCTPILPVVRSQGLLSRQQQKIATKIGKFIFF